MSLDTTPIDKFMARVRATAQSRSKDVRLTAEEAMELAGAIGQALARLTALETRSGASVEQVQFDGGTLGR